MEMERFLGKPSKLAEQFIVGGNIINYGDNDIYESYRELKDKGNVLDENFCLSGSVSHLRRVYQTSRNFTDMKAGTFMSTPIEHFDSSSITNIQNAVFRNCFLLSAVHIPNLSSVGDNAFTQSAIRSVKFPELKTTGTASFGACQRLNSVDAPQVLSIGNQAFAGCISLENVNVLAVEHIGGSAFNGCTKLSSINCPNVTTIESMAFMNCSNLSVIDFTDRTSTSAPTLENKNAFEGLPADYKIIVPESLYDSWLATPNWSTVSSHIFVRPSIFMTVANGEEQGFSYNQISAYQGNTGTINYRSQVYPYDVTNPFIANEYLSSIDNLYAVKIQNENISAIGSHAFNSCKKLSSVECSNVVSIDSDAFSNCISLYTMKLPMVTTTKLQSFQNCKKLSSIECPNVTTIGPQSFSDCESITSIELPNVITIGSNAFSHCYKLSSVKCSNVKYIGSGAFTSCIRLSSIECQDVSSISSYAFQNCTNLSSIECIGITSLNRSTFDGCTNLLSIELPNVTSIDSYVFSRCSNLSVVDFSGVTSTSVPTLDNKNSFSGLPSNYMVKVPASLYDNWIAATNWTLISSHIESV